MVALAFLDVGVWSPPAWSLICRGSGYYGRGVVVEGEYLKLLVDGRVVTAAYLVRLEEGVVAGWPPEALGGEIFRLVEELSVPMDPGLYFVVGGDRLSHRYVGLVMGGGLLLLRVGEGVSGETLAAHLSRIFEMVSSYGRRVRKSARKSAMSERSSAGAR